MQPSLFPSLITYKLRPYQEAAVSAIKNWIKYKNTPAIASLPTGSGKTIVIRELIDYAYRQNQQVLLLAHRKELLEQAADKLGEIPFAYYSASIGEKRLDAPVTIANVQSISRVEDLPQYDVIIVDECHRVSDNKEGQYWNILTRQPQAKLVGVTATPYRMKGGKLQWGEVVYEIGYDELIKAGYLTKPINKVTAHPNLQGVTILSGEYLLGELEEAMADIALMEIAVEKIKAYTKDRNSVLIFCVSLKHAALTKEALRVNGIDAAILTGDMPMEERDLVTSKFKDGLIKYLINVEVLLEGFDAPRVDCIVCLRPTLSPGLWQQMLGRGVRLHPDKKDCLVLDMAGNFMQNGGLGAPQGTGERETKRNLGKICPSCETITKPTARECPDCGYAFPAPEVTKIDHNREFDSESDTIYKPREPEIFDVGSVTYREHRSKKTGNICIRVEYRDAHYGSNFVSEYLSPFSDSAWARGNVEKFFKDGGHELSSPVNSYSMEDLLWHAEQCKSPIRVTIAPDKKNPKYDRIIRKEYEPEAPKPLSEVLDDDEVPF